MTLACATRRIVPEGLPGGCRKGRGDVSGKGGRRKACGLGVQAEAALAWEELVTNHEQESSPLGEREHIIHARREFPGGPVVRTRRFHCHGLGSIPGWGTKIPQAGWP